MLVIAAKPLRSVTLSFLANSQMISWTEVKSTWCVWPDQIDGQREGITCAYTYLADTVCKGKQQQWPQTSELVDGKLRLQMTRPSFNLIPNPIGLETTVGKLVAGRNKADHGHY